MTFKALLVLSLFCFSVYASDTLEHSIFKSKSVCTGKSLAQRKSSTHSIDIDSKNTFDIVRISCDNIINNPKIVYRRWVSSELGMPFSRPNFIQSRQTPQQIKKLFSSRVLLHSKCCQVVSALQKHRCEMKFARREYLPWECETFNCWLLCMMCWYLPSYVSQCMTIFER